MNQKQNPEHSVSPDLVVVGGGVFGLWAARRALQRGERVLVLEKRRIGAGASGGFLGALMPHMPDTWNAKKQLQYDGLVSLPDAIATLEDDTGHNCGYRRCGRLMPLRHEKMIRHIGQRVAGAKAHWSGHAGKSAYVMEHVSPDDLVRQFVGPGGRPWLSPELAQFGAQFDTLSARVDPRAYIGALAAYVRQHPKGAIMERTEVNRVSQGISGAEVTLADSSVIHSSQVLIANGWEAYGLLGAMNAQRLGQSVVGRGVKGQAILLTFDHDDSLPIIYDDGSYVVPHADGKVAVGSTSVNDWLEKSDYGNVADALDPKSVDNAISWYDPTDTGYFDHAMTLCPGLRSAQVTERWANVRPRNTIRDEVTGKVGTDPVFGPLDGAERISVAVGGFKISFGLAHLEFLASPSP